MRVVPCSAIHGDKDQHQRNRTLQDFKDGRTPVMIATDVAARGLDVKDVKAVINFDFPSNVEDYVHRIGRTARGGAEGKAYTFFTADDSKRANELIDLLKRAEQEIPAELLRYQTNRSSGGSSFGGGRFGGRFGGRGGYGGGRGGGFSRGGGGRGRGW
jgi:ATP-dependent RNA helicase DDX5/DBP2